jgi:hypothetical protein
MTDVFNRAQKSMEEVHKTFDHLHDELELRRSLLRSKIEDEADL